MQRNYVDMPLRQGIFPYHVSEIGRHNDLAWISRSLEVRENGMGERVVVMHAIMNVTLEFGQHGWLALGRRYYPTHLRVGSTRVTKDVEGARCVLEVLTAPLTRFRPGVIQKVEGICGITEIIRPLSLHGLAAKVQALLDGLEEAGLQGATACAWDVKEVCEGARPGAFKGP
eukprot:scaffold7701_cov430-Prasinococcus_capsulatus_cf.AAC.2